MASKVLVFDELPENAQIMVATQSGGNLIGRATDYVPGTGSPGFIDIEVSDANHTFNGDGSAGAIQIFPLTIIRLLAAESAVAWQFNTPAVTSCFVVAFNVEGELGVVTINDQDGNPLLVIDTTNFGAPPETNLVAAIYFDTLSGAWALLRNDIHVP